MAYSLYNKFHIIPLSLSVSDTYCFYGNASASYYLYPVRECFLKKLYGIVILILCLDTLHKDTVPVVVGNVVSEGIGNPEHLILVCTAATVYLYK